MKGFLKGVSIAALVIFIIGIGLVMFGAFMGGAPLSINYSNGNFHFFRNWGFPFHLFEYNESRDDYYNDFKDDFNDAMSDVKDDVKDAMNDVSDSLSEIEKEIFTVNPNTIITPKVKDGTAVMKDDIRSLNFDLGAAEVYVMPGDEFSFKATGNWEYNVYVSGSTWFAKLSNKHINYYKDEKVFITFPKGYEFNEVDIEMGAGKITVEDITANEIDFVVGAGKFNGKNIKCYGEASFEAGASQMDISGTFEGKTSVDCGAGQLTLELDEKPAEYGYSVEVGLGQAKIFGESFNGIADREYNKSARPFFEIEVGVGQVVIK